MKNQKLIITKIDKNIVSALVEDGEIAELHCNETEPEDATALGDIYIGKVKKIAPDIRAAFIEISPGKECYYALSDRQNQHPVFTNRQGKKAPLCVGDELLVQIQREALKTKVPSVTSNINLTGKYAVLTTGDNKLGISGKIEKEKRECFKEIVAPYQTGAYGWIVRTNAREVSQNVLQEELEHLASDYQQLMQEAQTRTCYTCLRHALKPYIADLRNLYQSDLEEIVVEDEILYSEIRDFLAQEQPEDLAKLRRYQDPLLPLHKLYSVEHILQGALRERVWLKSGGYLVIQPTEALTVIDVNSGKSITKKSRQDANTKTNLEAAREVPRQIRLRNLSGIILVDFINADREEDMEHLVDILSEELRKDPIPASFVDITKLQLVEITRKKVRRPLHEIFPKNFSREGD